MVSLIMDVIISPSYLSLIVINVIYRPIIDLKLSHLVLDQEIMKRSVIN